MTYPLRGNLALGWHVPVSDTLALCGVELVATKRVVNTTTRVISRKSVCETCLRIARDDRQLRSKL